MKQSLTAISEIASRLEGASIPYTFIGEASCLIQGMEAEAVNIEVLIQWDVFEKARELFIEYHPSEIEKNAWTASCGFSCGSHMVRLLCRYNTTVRTDPYRIAVDGLWCLSLYSYMYDAQGSADKEAIVDFLLQKQLFHTDRNRQAWNQNNYTALTNRYGTPENIAEKIKQNPEWRLYPFLKYMGELKGKKVLHLLGSNGVKGVAMAELGADVTVVDFSEENALFAKETARAAGVDLTYIVSDVNALNREELNGRYDIILMELGVLHYFLVLEPLMTLIRDALAPNGRYILHEFHPVSTKLITSSGKKHKADGNYFAPELTYQNVAFRKHMPDEQLLETVHRKWTIGEVVTAAASSGLVIDVLEEEPNHKLHDIGIPKTYTLVAGKR